MKHFITITLILFSTISASTVYSQESKITRDPFAPYEFQGSEDGNIYSERKFKLTGIIWDKENPSAVVQFSKFKKIIFKGYVSHFELVPTVNQQVNLRPGSARLVWPGSASGQDSTRSALFCRPVRHPSVHCSLAIAFGNQHGSQGSRGGRSGRWSRAWRNASPSRRCARNHRA